MTIDELEKQKEIVRLALNASIDLAHELLDKPSTSSIMTIFNKMIPTPTEMITLQN